MATLKDVQYSLMGEQKQQDSSLHNQISGLVEYDGEKPAGETDKEWVLFKLKDNTKKGGVYIPNVDDVVNPKTKKVERIRLLSGVDTIWMKEQKDLTPEFVRQNQRSIQFPRGVKIRRISKTDHTALEFMRLCNSNIGNKKRIGASKFEYYEYDSQIAEKEAYEKEAYEIKAAIIASQEPLETMKKHAAFLGIRMINDIGEPKSEDGIRMEYSVYAKRNPKYFMDTKGTTEVEISWLVKRAIVDSKIEINREPGKIYWAKNGGMICVCPQTIQPERYLVELALTNSEEGIKFKNELQRVTT